MRNYSFLWIPLIPRIPWNRPGLALSMTLRNTSVASRRNLVTMFSAEGLVCFTQYQGNLHCFATGSTVPFLSLFTGINSMA